MLSLGIDPTSGTSPPNNNEDGYPKWEGELAVVVAHQGQITQWDAWWRRVTCGNSSCKQKDYARARECYADACRSLCVDTVEDARALNHFHPAMLKVLLRFAGFADEILDFHLMADVHVRLALVLKGLIEEYEGWVQVKAVFGRELLGTIQAQSESFINATSQWKAQIQAAPQPGALSQQCTELRKHAQQMLTAFDAEHASGKLLDHLRNAPRPLKRQ